MGTFVMLAYLGNIERIGYEAMEPWAMERLELRIDHIYSVENARLGLTACFLKTKSQSCVC